MSLLVIPGRAPTPKGRRLANPESKGKLGGRFWIPDTLASLAFRNDKKYWPVVKWR